MKMVKKILLGLTASAAVLAFVGCKTVDDEEGAIQGKNNDYSVTYENTDTENNYRAYKSTNLKHAGGLVKVTFDEPDDNNFSKMGVLFDLHDNAANPDAKDFFIIGLAGSSTYNFYVSKFTNVTDLQADNFGTELASNPAVETEYVSYGAAITQPAAAADGSISYYVYFKANTNGSYDWAVLNATDALVADCEITADTSINDLPTGGSILTYKNSTTKVMGQIPAPTPALTAVPQNQLAVYINVIKTKTLKGKWKFLDMYKEAEEIEE